MASFSGTQESSFSLPREEKWNEILFLGSEGDERHLIPSLGLWALGVSEASGLWDPDEEVAGPLALLTP